MDEHLETQAHESAQAFLEALRPTSGLWGSVPGRWAFRGHGNADWPLVPTILRNDTWKQYLSPSERKDADSATGPDRWFLQAFAEWRALVDFRDLADRCGLAVPDDGQFLRSKELRLLTSQRGFPPAQMLSQLALAQHYGVPTRLLDWTWRHRVAAYFAASDALKEESAELAVWAIRTGFIVVAFEFDDTPTVTTVMAPQASNPNLAAQSGLFTLDREAVDDTSFDVRIGKRVEKKGPALLKLMPIFRKLTLATEHAEDLLRLLHLDEVHAGTLFPGYAGVVQALAERKMLGLS